MRAAGAGDLRPGRGDLRPGRRTPAPRRRICWRASGRCWCRCSRPGLRGFWPATCFGAGAAWACGNQAPLLPAIFRVQSAAKVARPRGGRSQFWTCWQIPPETRDFLRDDTARAKLPGRQGENVLSSGQEVRMGLRRDAGGRGCDRRRGPPGWRRQGPRTFPDATGIEDAGDRRGAGPAGGRRLGNPLTLPAMGIAPPPQTGNCISINLVGRTRSAEGHRLRR